MDRLELSTAVTSLWKLVGRANKYIDEQAPWALAKDPAKAGQLQNVLYSLAESLRILGVALTPFLVYTPEKIWDQLGLEPDQVRTLPWEEAVAWGGLKAGTPIRRGAPLFPRIEAEKEVAPVQEKQAEQKPAAAPQVKAAEPIEGVAQIEYDDFTKVELKVAEVIEAERIPKADRLLKLQLAVGEERRQIVSGIAQHYTPEELVGKRIILVSNLKPKALRGVESHGMLLAATAADGRLSLVTLDKADFPSGMRVK
jgi:methionyl-tRNA synthetase